MHTKGAKRRLPFFAFPIVCEVAKRALLVHDGIFSRNKRFVGYVGI
jgi:hypothetical protein